MKLRYMIGTVIFFTWIGTGCAPVIMPVIDKPTKYQGKPLDCVAIQQGGLSCNWAAYNEDNKETQE